jgi:3-hydroxyisobutyrate dehydrogenase-like beta-hydroxyacid dehydrogenase
VLVGDAGVLTAAPPPAIACVLSTVTLDTLRWAGDVAQRAGVMLIDCGVTGGQGLRTHGTIVVLAGGSDAALARARPALEAFAAPLLHIGPVGAGMQAKLARNLMHYSGWYAAWEAASIAVACGIDVDKLVEAHEVSNRLSSGGGTSLLRRGIGPGMIEPNPGANLTARCQSADFARKDLGYVLELASELGLSLPGAELVLARIDEVVGLAGSEPTSPPVTPPGISGRAGAGHAGA